MTPDEYLRRERAAETKSEYDDGFVYAWPVADAQHSLIAAALIGALGNHLRPRCLVYPSNMRLRISNPTRFFYPDVSVVRDEPQYADDDLLINPLIIFEVVSESSMALDHGRKFLSYQTIESLEEYVLVWQDEPLVEHYRRRDGQWVYTVARGLDAELSLPAVECELSLSEIYDQVDFA